MMIKDLNGEPITSLSPGDEILVPGFFGDYFKMTMGDSNIADSEGGMCALIKYDSESKRFHLKALLDSRRINTLDL